MAFKRFGKNIHRYALKPRDRMVRHVMEASRAKTSPFFSSPMARLEVDGVRLDFFVHDCVTTTNQAAQFGKVHTFVP